MSGGRLTVILGLGYRPSEYQLLGKDWDRRGKIMDESIEILLKAWSGEPFEYNGGTHQISANTCNETASVHYDRRNE